MKGMISVIVPVYNVAPYLPEAVESILNQNYRELEVILIDDGSKDASGAICDGFAAKDQRVKVIHQKNGGAAAAKNAGLRMAQGEFLSFVDSDDYLDPNVYGYMVNLLETEEADAVHCEFRNVYKTRQEDFVLHPGRSAIDPVSYLKRYHRDWTCALLWNKLYRRTLFEGVFFEEGHRIDDEFFTYQGMMKAEKIIMDDRIIYNYRRRASSVMNVPKVSQQLQFDRADYMDQRRRIVTACYPELKCDFDVHYMDALLYLSKNADNTPATIKMLRSRLLAYLKTPGHTRPPRYLLKPMLKLFLTRTDKLLGECEKRTEMDMNEYFA